MEHFSLHGEVSSSRLDFEASCSLPSPPIIRSSKTLLTLTSRPTRWSKLACCLSCDPLTPNHTLSICSLPLLDKITVWIKNCGQQKHHDSIAGHAGFQKLHWADRSWRSDHIFDQYVRSSQITESLSNMKTKRRRWNLRPACVDYMPQDGLCKTINTWCD